MRLPCTFRIIIAIRMRAGVLVVRLSSAGVHAWQTHYLYADTGQGMKLQHHRRVEVAQNVAAPAQ
jgi:hypothetical protein